MPRKPCAAIFMTPVIQWNGDVTTCCHDPLMELKIGNVNETPLDELWYGEEMTKRRIAQIKGDFSYPPRCLHCKNVDGIEITHEQVIEYLQNIKREDLIEQYVKRHKVKLKAKSRIIKVSSKEIIIDVFSPVKAEWNKEYGSYKGEDGFGKGYEFIHGSVRGFFEYEFLGKAKSIEIEFQIASFDLNREAKFIVFLNHELIGKGIAKPLAAGKGQNFSFFVRKPKLFPKNRLRIESESGICLMGNSLEKGLKNKNITVRMIS